MYGATLCKIAASTDTNCGIESKNRLKREYLIFNVYFKKLTFGNLTDGKKSKNHYNYQISRRHWNFATLLNLHRPMK